MTYRGTGIDVAWIQDKTFLIMRRENFSFIDFESQLLCTSIDINMPVHGAWNRKGQLDLIFGISFWIILFDLVNSKVHHFFHSVQFSSADQSCPTLQPHESQHTRPCCPSSIPAVHPNPCPLSRWCHPTNSSSVIPFSYCPQSFPASGSFPVSQLFASDGQSTEVSASASVLPMNTQDWSPLGGLVGSPCSPRDSQESSPIPQFKSINSLVLSFLHSPILTSIHDHWKNHSLD